MSDNFKGKFPQKHKQTILFTTPVTSSEAEKSIAALCRLKSLYDLAAVLEVDLDGVASREVAHLHPRKLQLLWNSGFMLVISIILYSQLH